MVRVLQINQEFCKSARSSANQLGLADSAADAWNDTMHQVLKDHTSHWNFEELLHRIQDMSDMILTTCRVQLDRKLSYRSRCVTKGIW